MILNRAAWLAVVALVPSISFAQTNQSPSLVLPTVIVTAQKEAADLKEVPASITAVTADTISDSGLRVITDAAIFAPNTLFAEFTARKDSHAHFRGIGPSAANPGITTYLDGVPQLNSNSSNIELLDVSQIEFVRAPQSSLFGRNTLGGIVNVTSAKPSMTEWTGTVMAPFGSAGAWEVRGNASGPIGEKAAVGIAAGKQRRDGFTKNQTTGNKIDARDGTFTKAQLLYVPNANWEARVLYAYERDRDGDYAFGDLSAIRIAPFHIARDFEGFTNRDINNTTINIRGIGQNFSIASTTGLIKWKTADETDLDYSPLPLARRSSTESDFQFTQEVRISSPENAPIPLGSTMVKWQAGIEYFNQNYDQDAVNTLSAFGLSPQAGFPVAIHSPEASIDTAGFGLFGRGTMAFNDQAELTAGLRFDHESGDAHLNTFVEPAITTANIVAAEKSFSNVSPQLAFSYRVKPEHMAYASVSRGYKAGGFNPVAPAGNEAYGEEHAWQIETGVKSTLSGGRVAANAALFFINWDDLQLSVPNTVVPGQFSISNVGSARSSGVEFDVTARPAPGVDVFAAIGFTSASFSDGTTANGAEVSGHAIPYSPDYTASFGGQLTRAITSAVNGYARAEIVLTGAFEYDEGNTQSQEAYSLVNLRAGARYKRLFGDLWLRNAFDTHYVPFAIPYPGFAPSGFIGENGRPRTFGISIGTTF